MRPAILLSLVCFAVSLNPPDAPAQPAKGDKTIHVHMNRIMYGRDTYDRCDKGSPCREESKETHWSVGAGIMAGYLLTDMVEVGGGFEVSKAKQKADYTQSDTEFENPYSRLSGMGYGKVHIASGSRLVPYVRAGGSVGYTNNKSKLDGETVYEEKRFGFTLFGAGGLDFYVGEKHAITCFMQFTYARDSADRDFKAGPSVIPDYDPDYEEKLKRYVLDFGFGVTTYF